MLLADVKRQSEFTIMGYLKRLSKSLTDEKDLGTEMLLTWIAVMLTLLTIFAVLDVVARGFGA